MTDVVGGGPVSASAFIGLADLKAFLGISGSDYDHQLEPIVDGINASIPRYTGRNLLSDDYVERQDGREFLREIYLREYPVTAVSKVEYKCGTSWTEVDDSEYTLASSEESESNVGLVFLECDTLPEGYKNVRVSYTAGYSTIPDDLTLAALQVCQQAYRDIKAGKRIQSENLGDYSYTLMTSPSYEALLDAQRVFQRYRRAA